MIPHKFYARLTVSFQRSGLRVCGFCIIFFLSFCHLGKFPLISGMKHHNFYTRLTVSFQRSGLRVCERRRGVIFGVFYSSGGCGVLGESYSVSWAVVTGVGYGITWIQNLFSVYGFRV
jgi:hypothetical protein